MHQAVLASMEMTLPKFSLLMGLVLAAPFSALCAEPIPCPLDPLLKIPENWQMTPDKFEKTFS